MIKQGEKGDYFYVVNSGHYEVFITGTDEPVVSYEHPALFGALPRALYPPPASLRPHRVPTQPNRL